MYKLILEGTATIKGSKITGRALSPTISRNGNVYTDEVIDNAKNLNIPLILDWEHTPEAIGHVIFKLNSELHEIYYEGYIENEERSSQIKNGTYKASIEASVMEVSQTCNKVRCYNMPLDLTLEGLGITQKPSVQTTTLTVLESYQGWKPIIDKHCTKCQQSILVESSGKQTIQEVSVDSIARDILQKQLEQIEARILIKWEILQLLEEILTIDQSNIDILIQIDMCKADLVWLVNDLIFIRNQLKGVKSSEKVNEIINKISEINSIKPESILQNIREAYCCSKCGMVRKTS